MKPSFFYLVDRSDAARLCVALAGLGVPYTTEDRGGQVIFVFSDLPVRQYGAVRELFGGDGWPYQRWH